MYNLFKRTPFEHFGTFNSMELELVVACTGVSFGNIERFFEYMLLITLHLGIIFFSLCGYHKFTHLVSSLSN